ncbi:MAG TPA: MBOAT family protein [Methylomirabilota bacterium]|nr:MBOAT family protein [Methylomirabilota bacterium]
MVFSSITFLFLFLPGTLVAYHIMPRPARNAFLVAVSLLFYTWGAGWVVLVLIGSIAWNYIIGGGIERSVDREDRAAARRYLAIGVVVNVAALVWFKYANFGVDQADMVLASLGLPALPWKDVLLPIGISFYTFHSLSFLIDVYRGTARHLVNPIDFALYIAFFPQLIAGPIVRFHEIRDQLVHRTETADQFATGVLRFAHGLGKKVLIADTVAPVADAVFAAPTDALGTSAAVLGTVAFAIQLYFDFSGYSDMAIGIALMFGIHLPENFERPYSAASITEFWRRWHMSLSRWFRDYLYIPLGGNRGSAGATYRNLIIVFLITGLWHGAAWTFVLWGGYHGVLLLLERRYGIGRGGAIGGEVGGATPGGRPRAGGAYALARTRTLILVLLGWVLFRAGSLPDAIGVYQAFLRPEIGLTPKVVVALDPMATIALVVGALSFLLPASWVTGVRLELDRSLPVGGLRLAELALVLPIALLVAAAGGFSPFLYFQF